LHGDIQTSFNSFSRFKDFISDCINRKVVSNLDFKDDVLGTLGVFYNLFQKLFKLR
jgi:hypothetical protein